MSPWVDGLQITGTSPSPDFIIEAGPRESHRTGDEDRVTSFTGISVHERRCDATMFDILKPRLGARACERILLPQTKKQGTDLALHLGIVDCKHW